MGKKPQTNKGRARAAAKPKTGKAAKPTVAEKQAKQVEAAKVAAGHNSVDPALRDTFIRVHKPAVDRAHKALQTANSNLRKAYKTALADGFTKAQFDVARLLSTDEGEAKFKADLAEQMAAAQYIGSDVGTMLGQLELFAPSRTDATERAYDEGQLASMESRPAKPDYAPGTAQYESYMKGFHDHQKGIASGFQSTDKGAKPAAERKRQARAAAPAEAPPAQEEPPAEEPQGQPETPPSPNPPVSRAEYNRLKAEPETPPPANPPVSGQPLSRAEYNRLMQEQQSQFTKAN